MGSIIKCLAIYDEPFWRGDGFNGQAVPTSLAVHATFDNSPPDGSPGILLGFLAAAMHARWRESTKSERRHAVLSSLAAFFGPRAARPCALRRDGLVGPGMDPRVLCGPLRPRRMDGVWGSSYETRWETALGRHGIGHDLDRLHGRCGAIWPASRGRGPRPSLSGTTRPVEAAGGL